MADWTIAALVGRLTEALRGEPGVKPEQIDTVRRLLARDLSESPDRAEALAQAIEVDEPVSDIQDVETALATAEADDTVRLIGNRRATVEARTLANSMPTTIRGFEDRLRNMRADLSLGPFRRPDGTLTIFDVFLAAARLSVQVEGEDLPLLVLTSGRRRTTQRNPDIDVEPGTVWIRADAVSGDAPVDRYVGFRVTDGAVDLEGTTRFADGVITVPAPFKGAIRLTLEDVRPSGPDLCPDADIIAPARLTIRWSGGIAIEIDGGSAALFGQTFQFSPTGGVSFDAADNRLQFACKVEPTVFDGGAVETRLAALSGQTEIVDADWVVGLSRLAPAALGEASGEGAWRMVGKQPLGAKWLGGPAGWSRMTAPTILASHALFTVASRQTSPPSAEAQQRFDLWALGESGKPLPLITRFPDPFTLIIGCDTARGDYVSFLSLTTPVLDKPVDAMGRQIPSTEVVTGTMLRDVRGSTSVMMQALSGRAPALAGDPVRLVLENAYLSVYGPLLLGFSGTMQGDRRVVDGELGLVFRVGNWMPTLPDPYVTNLITDKNTQSEAMQRGMLITRITWSDLEPPVVRFEGSIAAPVVDGKTSSTRATGPGVGDDVPYFGDSQSADGAVPRSPEQEAAWSEAIEAADPSTWRDLDQRIAEAEARHAAVVNVGQEMMGQGGGGMLLDVSTNRHQIGVAIGVGRSLKTPLGPLGAASGAQYAVQNQSVWTQTDNVAVFTVPAVQWEPVRTLDIDQDVARMGYFPTPLASADDGGATVLGMQSATLTATIPDLALETMVDEFGRGRGMGMVTTLPFGLKAGLMLQPSDDGGRRADTADFTVPRFDGTAAGRDLAGGLQLTLKAEGGRENPGGESPTFVGATVQLLNGVDLATGNPQHISVLGETMTPAASVETMFNREFADSQTGNPRVPLTRYDVSGYGASSFSDWVKPTGSFAETTKVQFALMVGRTALEVIKVASMIYPWGIRVTRSVTIERRGGGGVVRRDSGWQPSSPGLFDFRVDNVAPNEMLALEKHPGLIEGVFAPENIRGLGRPAIQLPDGGEVVPMAFDCEVAIDGVGGTGRTRCAGMIGYLHLAPLGAPITQAALAALFEAEGPTGGPIDTTFRVGGSRFAMRGLRVEVDGVRDAGGDLTLVGAVRGAPVFGPSGAWSVIRHASAANGGSPAEAEKITDGTPVIRQGLIGNPTGTRLTYPAGRGALRFAEAEDLHRVNAPMWEIGFLQTTATHAFLFRRPTLQFGANKIMTTEPPLLADMFLRTLSGALFPAEAQAITLGNTGYHFDIAPVGADDGLLSLNPPVQVHNPRPEVIVSEGPDQFRVDYTNCHISLEIEPRAWSMAMRDLELWNDLESFARVSGMRVQVAGGTSTPPQLTRVETLIADPIEKALQYLPGMQSRGSVGPIALSGTNLKVKSKVAATFGYTYDFAPLIVLPFFGPLQIPSLFAITVYGKVFIGLEADLDKDKVNALIGAAVGLDMRIRVPAGAVLVVLGVAIELGGKVYFAGELAGKAKGFFELKIYIGFGQGGDLTLFSAEWLIGFGPIMVLEGGVWKVGGFVFFEAKAEFLGSGITLLGEFAALQFDDVDPDTGNLVPFLEFGGEVGFKIKIAKFFTAKFTIDLFFVEKL